MEIPGSERLTKLDTASYKHVIYLAVATEKTGRIGMPEMQGEDIEWLVADIREGDKKAFEKLFLKFYAPLTKFVWRYVRSSHIAEELVQELFMELWQTRSHIDPDQNIKSYLYQSVKNKALNHIKHRELSEEYNEKIEWLNASPTTQTHTFDEASEFELAAKKAIEELPDGARQIYKLSRKDGLTYSEIAEVLEISPKTVESQMSRALKILRRTLTPFLPMAVALIAKII